MFPSSQSGARPEFKTDALRPSALPSAAIRPRNEVQQPELTSEQYLNQVYEEWDKKVDAEVETLVDGMVDLVSIATIGNKDKYRIAQEAFQAQARTESMVRAATSLLSITHSLKLLLLLSDEKEIIRRRDEAAECIEYETTGAQQRVLVALDKLLGRTGEEPNPGLESQVIEKSDEAALQDMEEE